MTQAPPPPPPPTRSRSSLRPLWIVLGILVVLVLVAGAVFAVGFALSETATSGQTLSPEEVEAIEVRGTAGDVQVVVEDREDIRVESRRSSSLWTDAVSEVEVRDGVLSVVGDCDPDWFVSFCTVEHTIAVPPDVVSRLDVTTTAGAVEVLGFGGDVDAETTAGSVELLDFAGETATLTTTAGQITLEARVAPQLIEATTTAGEIDVLVPDEVYHVSTQTTVGDVDVDVRQDPDADRRIDVETTAGSVTVRSP